MCWNSILLWTIVPPSPDANQTALSVMNLASYAPLVVRDSCEPINPIANCISPFDCFSGLVLKSLKNVAIPLLTDSAVECFPLRHELRCMLCAFVMRIVDVLNYRLTRMQLVGVGYVVKKQEQVIGAGDEGFIQLLYSGRILSDEPGSCRHRAIHANP